MLLDTFNDEENALWFAISPTGNRTDVIVSNDATATGNPSPFDISGNTNWDEAVSQNEDRHGGSGGFHRYMALLGEQAEN